MDPRKITTDPGILAQVNTVCPDNTYSKLKIYISVLILDCYEYIFSRICNNALHDLILIKIMVAGFVGFLIRHSNGHKK